MLKIKDIFLIFKDYVRKVVFSPSSSDLVLSGSYDHRLKLWDLRTGTAVCECDHGHPIETLLVFPSGGMGMTAGGNVVRVWDLLRGERGRAVASFSNHQKTVTSLAFDGSCGRLLSAGLDKYGFSTHTHTHAHTRKHARTRTHAHAHTGR